jgi:hypothetical protein
MDGIRAKFKFSFVKMFKNKEIPYQLLHVDELNGEDHQPALEEAPKGIKKKTWPFKMLQDFKMALMFLNTKDKRAKTSKGEE